MKKLILASVLFLMAGVSFASPTTVNFTTECIEGQVVVIIQSDKGITAFQLKNEDGTFKSCSN